MERVQLKEFAGNELRETLFCYAKIYGFYSENLPIHLNFPAHFNGNGKFK